MIKEELLHRGHFNETENTSKFNKMEVLKGISEDLNKRKTELEKEKSNEENKLREVVRKLEISITNLKLFLQTLDSHSILKGFEIGATLNPNNMLENPAIGPIKVPVKVPDLSNNAKEPFYIRMKEEYASKVKNANKIANTAALASIVGVISILNLFIVGISAISSIIFRRFADNRIKEAIPNLKSIATEELELKRQELNSVNNILSLKQKELDGIELRIKSVDEKIKEIELEIQGYFQKLNEERIEENGLWRKDIDCIEESKVKTYKIKDKPWKSLEQ